MLSSAINTDIFESSMLFSPLSIFYQCNYYFAIYLLIPSFNKKVFTKTL
nr:MAG TPA: hypothetical protein [Caudoviricetes sp.]